MTSDDLRRVYQRPTPVAPAWLQYLGIRRRLRQLGLSGEYNLMSDEERDSVLRFVKHFAKPDETLIAGTNAPSTAGVIANTLRAKAMGYHAVLLAVPFYTKPTQAEIIRHFTALVTATAHCEGGKVVRATLDMPPSFAAKPDAMIETPQWGNIRYGLCFGGVFYGLIDVQQISLTISPQNARELARIGVDLRSCIAEVEPAIHPLTSALNGLAYVMFRSEEPDGVLRTCTTLRPGRADRSPCGTGPNSNMATRLARRPAIQLSFHDQVSSGYRQGERDDLAVDPSRNFAT